VPRANTREGARQEGKLESFGVAAFPKVGDKSRRFRAVIDVKNVPVNMDVIEIQRHATEITLTFTAPAAAQTTVDAAEVVFAARLAARAAA
jgi:hypothetical protein